MMIRMMTKEQFKITFFNTTPSPGLMLKKSTFHLLSVIYCIKCTLCKKIYIGETRRRLGDRFREHLRDIERIDKNASKPVARHFHLPDHSSQHMTICGLSLHQGNKESCEQKFLFQIGILNPHGIDQRTLFIQRIHSCFSRCHVPINSVAPPFSI